MKPIMIKIAGHTHVLKCTGFHSECGTTDDGLVFEFFDRETGEGEGCWVVDPESLVKVLEASGRLK